jgi:uncharacterized protein (TIGR00299 family) protein
MGFAVRVLLLEPFTGISGDMLLGALVDLGVEIAVLEKQVNELGLADRVQLKVTRTDRNGIAAAKVDVLIDGELEIPDEVDRGHGNSTTVKDILNQLDTSLLDTAVREKSAEVFTRLGDAEARVHGSDPGRVHLHETGALDAVVDVVCGVAAILSLEVDTILSIPPSDGYGEVRSAHGILPVPVPATAYLLEGVPVRRIDIPFELITPTGAAMLTTLVDSFTSRLALTPERIGYGAGTRQLDGRPNLLRATLGDLDDADTHGGDRIAVLESTVDDALPEIWPYLIERLLDGGARDAYVTPVVMKKGRPGIHLTVLCDPVDLSKLQQLVFEETGTLGIRISYTGRMVLARARGRLETSLGPIEVKLSSLPEGGRWRVHPEYEACRRTALERRVPLRDVYREIAVASEIDGALTVEGNAEPSGAVPIIDPETK